MSRHLIILGYYVFFVKFVGNRNKQWFFIIIIWKNAGKSLTHSSCFWEKWFLQKMMDLYRNSNVYAVSIKGNPSIFGTTSIYGNRDDSYCFLPFSCNLKISSLISHHLISLLIKINSRKFDIPTYIELSKKSKKIWQIWLVPKILQGENILWTVLSTNKN